MNCQGTDLGTSKNDYSKKKPEGLYFQWSRGSVELERPSGSKGQVGSGEAAEVAQAVPVGSHRGIRLDKGG
jgi:hypothetical protein